MVLSVQIPFASKKIGIPFKKTLTVKDFIQEIVKRAALPTSDTYILEYNSSELFADDTLEDLNIKEDAELTLRSPPSHATSGNILSIQPLLYPVLTKDSKTEVDVNNNNSGNIGVSQMNNLVVSTPSLSVNINSWI